jgi:hypothetical protein
MTSVECNPGWAMPGRDVYQYRLMMFFTDWM